MCVCIYIYIYIYTYIYVFMSVSSTIISRMKLTNDSASAKAAHDEARRRESRRVFSSERKIREGTDTSALIRYAKYRVRGKLRRMEEVSGGTLAGLQGESLASGKQRGCLPRRFPSLPSAIPLVSLARGRFYIGRTCL